MKPVMTVEDVDALKRDALRKRIDALAQDAGTADAAAAAVRGALPEPTGSRRAGRA